MTNRHYINNKSFYEEMIKFKNQCEEAKVLSKPTPVISNYIGQCFLHICGNRDIFVV